MRRDRDRMRSVGKALSSPMRSNAAGAMPFTDDSIYPFKNPIKYRGKKLTDIPDSYLLWLLDQMRDEAIVPMTKKARLLEYLKDNEDAMILNEKNRKERSKTYR